MKGFEYISLMISIIILIFTGAMTLRSMSEDWDEIKKELEKNKDDRSERSTKENCRRNC